MTHRALHWANEALDYKPSPEEVREGEIEFRRGYMDGVDAALSAARACNKSGVSRWLKSLREWRFAGDMLNRFEKPPDYNVFRKRTHPERAKMSKARRLAILKRDKYTCQKCGKSPKLHGVALEVDHIVPVDKGGKTVESNLETLCFDCNRGKSNSL